MKSKKDEYKREISKSTRAKQQNNIQGLFCVLNRYAFAGRSISRSNYQFVESLAKFPQ